MYAIRSLLLAGDTEEAAAATKRAVSQAFGLTVTDLKFSLDEYSLNSLSGRIRLSDGTVQFFKFHTEEGETGNVAEYYRGRILADAGLPIDSPTAISTLPGQQIVLYEFRSDPRMADVCADLERRDGQAARLTPALARARQQLDQRMADVMLATVHDDPQAAQAAAIHQLFYHRLVGMDGTFPGARYLSWYVESPRWAEFGNRRWTVNGVSYSRTLDEIAETAARLLAPGALAADPVVTAHGDDHQGNTWVVSAPQPAGAGTPGAGHGDQQPQLRLFDPAFAGNDIPALLAPIKATFHNALAHPFWLYHPGEIEPRFHIEVNRHSGTIEVTDDVAMTPLRHQILDSLTDNIWIPLLVRLAQAGRLRADWRPVIRAGLAACPLLVTSLLGPPRTPPLEFLALARTVMAGSEPDRGDDVVTAFLDRLSAAVADCR